MSRSRKYLGHSPEHRYVVIWNRGDDEGRMYFYYKREANEYAKSVYGRVEKVDDN
jgi:hypothetical protein